MINFAINEQIDDAIISIKYLFQPWRWFTGHDLVSCQNKIAKLFAGLKPIFFFTFRSALYNLLKIIDLPLGSGVLVQAFTCEAVVLPILENQLKPVYVDIESKTFSMDIADLEAKHQDNCRVLILQHSFGITPKNHKLIVEFARNKKLILIEDIAHGCLPQNLSPDSLKIISFGRSKSLSSVFGGAVFTDDQKLEVKLQHRANLLENCSTGWIIRLLMYKPFAVLIKTMPAPIGKIIHFIFKKSKILIPEISNREKRGLFDRDFNKKYPNCLFALLNHQIEKIDSIQGRRTRSFNLYKTKINNIEGDAPLLSCGRYPLLVTNRKSAVSKLKKKGIVVGNWYTQVVGPNGIDLGGVGYSAGSCPNGEKIATQIINLPTDLPENKVNIIIDELQLIND